MAVREGSLLEVLMVATRLGCTSFGGPVAHLGYFRTEYVQRRCWVDEQTYADLVALCQFLPGPASSQVGIALGILRAGLLGGLAAWVGFTLPSAAALTLFGLGVSGAGLEGGGWLHGLKVVAVAVVAQAVWGMARSLCPDRARASLAVCSAILVLCWPTVGAQVGVIAAAGLFGWWKLGQGQQPPRLELRSPIGPVVGAVAWCLLLGLLVGLPLLRVNVADPTLAIVDAFFRVGSLVFGGGHVVLPLLWAETVPNAWVTADEFVAGYGATQAVPGPLFTFSAYLGTVMDIGPGGVAGAAICLAAVFAPSFLLVVGSLPLWQVVRSRPAFQAALSGVNAAVVGLLLAALYHPVATSALHTSADFALAIAAFALLALWHKPAWLVVLLSALVGAGIERLAS